nr:SulP family inorganic anion transporter [Thiothrix subterranea]
MGSWLVSLLSDWKDRFTPYKDWIGELKNPAVLKADAMAGLTVALVLIPQSMAYAQLAGLPPYIGLYASFLPVMVAAIFGSSRQLGTGWWRWFP